MRVAIFKDYFPHSKIPVLTFCPLENIESDRSKATKFGIKLGESDEVLPMGADGIIYPIKLTNGNTLLNSKGDLE